jgi:hypothetical protein
MAEDVDARQPPTRWHRGGEQVGLFDPDEDDQKYVIEGHPHSPKRGFNQLALGEDK